MKVVALAAALSLVVIPAFAHAVTLDPGQTATPDLLQLGPNDVDDFTGPNGPIASAVPLFDIDGGYSVDVMRDTTNNHLSFYFEMSYQVPIQLQSITFSGYQGYSVDAGYLNNRDVIPISVSRSLDGDDVKFSFDTPSTGDIELLIRTDATTYGNGTPALQFVGQSPIDGTFPIYDYQPAPSAAGSGPVPEPASLSLLALAAAGLALRHRRRH